MEWDRNGASFHFLCPNMLSHSQSQPFVQLSSSTISAVAGLPTCSTATTTSTATATTALSIGPPLPLPHLDSSTESEFRKYLLTLIQRSLDFRQYSDALFYAERLLASTSTTTTDTSSISEFSEAKEESLYYLALVHYQLDDMQSCFQLLRQSMFQTKRSVRCRYLLAQAGHRLKQFPEMEAVLFSIVEDYQTSMTAETADTSLAEYQEPVHLLLGTIARYYLPWVQISDV